MDSDFFLWGNASPQIHHRKPAYFNNGRGRTDLSSDKGQLTGNFNPDRKWTVEVGPNGLVG
jgi:hypothetical protein